MPSAQVHGVRLSRTLKGFLIMLINQVQIVMYSKCGNGNHNCDCNYKDLIMILALALDTR